MANTIKIKSSGVASNTPTALDNGELAINYADRKLFYRDNTNTIIGSKLITSVSGTTDQITVSESSGAFTISLPTNVKVTTLFVDNIEIDTTGALTNQALVYNGTKFVPSNIAGGTNELPIGGTTGQVLAKNSNTDYDVEWVDQTGGGGSVDDLTIALVSQVFG